jgi:acyl-CoA synthetase (NDP forming)
VRFSRVVSFGNAVDLNEADFLEYLIDEPNTKIVAAYLEGVRDGPRTFRALRALAARKSVVLLKGGVTVTGSRAARSHTGSLAGSARMWQSLARQTGVLLADSMAQLCDLLVVLNAFPDGVDDGIALVGSAGGASVLAADAFDRAGVAVPELPAETQRRLLEFTPVAGNSVRNPLDMFNITERDKFLRTVEIVDEAENINVIVLDVGIAQNARIEDRERAIEATIETIDEARRIAKKPLVVSAREPMVAELAQAWMDVQVRCGTAGIPSIPGIERTASALRRLIDQRSQRTSAD